MKQIITSKETLKKIANQNILLANLTKFAGSEHEAFSDVQIITLKQHLKDLATEQALNEMNASSVNCYTTMINRSDDLVQTKYTSAKEYVLITENSIEIAVNTTVIDDSAIDYALGLLLQVETLNPGNKYEFGKEVKPCL